MQDTQDPKYIAFTQFKHIELGKLYVHKDDPCKVFQFKEMKADTAQFEHHPFFGPCETVECQHIELKAWRKWDKEEPKLMDQSKLDLLLPSKSPMFASEQLKSAVQSAVQGNFSEHLSCHWFLKNMLFNKNCQQPMTLAFEAGWASSGHFQQP